jgi:hypothetical protein
MSTHFPPCSKIKYPFLVPHQRSAMTSIGRFFPPSFTGKLLQGAACHTLSVFRAEGTNAKGWWQETHSPEKTWLSGERPIFAKQIWSIRWGNPFYWRSPSITVDLLGNIEKEQYIQWGVCGSIYIMELSYHAMLLCLYLGSMNHSPIRCAITLVRLGNRGGFLHQWAFSDCFRGHCEQRSGVERLGGEDAMWIVFGLSIGNTWKMFPKDMSIWGFPEMGGSPK